MRYHAKLEGIDNLARPIETYSSDMDIMLDWAKEIVKKFPLGSVSIWEVQETLCGRVNGKDLVK